MPYIHQCYVINLIKFMTYRNIRHKSKMRNAIILTGSLRTIKRTAKFTRRNILECNKNNECDLFICIQNDSQEPDEKWEEWFHKEFNCIKSIVWFSYGYYQEWFRWRDKQLNNIPLEDYWRNFLKIGGSTIEYAQLQIAYTNMVEFEIKQRIKYDYIVRTRTDSIFSKPVDFHWLHWTLKDIEERRDRIKNTLISLNLPSEDIDVFKAFMCTVISDDVISNLSNIIAMCQYVPNPTETTFPKSVEEIYDYIHKGRYILTIRKNHLYIVRRDLFHIIPSLGYFYGCFKTDRDECWFNAESQFRDMCYYSCVSIIEYTTLFEERSLMMPYEWNEREFFDENFEVREDCKDKILWCCVRK